MLDANCTGVVAVVTVIGAVVTAADGAKEKPLAPEKLPTVDTDVTGAKEKQAAAAPIPVKPAAPADVLVAADIAVVTVDTAVPGVLEVIKPANTDDGGKAKLLPVELAKPPDNDDCTTDDPDVIAGGGAKAKPVPPVLVKLAGIDAARDGNLAAEISDVIDDMVGCENFKLPTGPRVPEADADTSPVGADTTAAGADVSAVGAMQKLLPEPTETDTDVVGTDVAIASANVATADSDVAGSDRADNGSVIAGMNVVIAGTDVARAPDTDIATVGTDVAIAGTEKADTGVLNWADLNCSILVATGSPTPSGLVLALSVDATPSDVPVPPGVGLMSKFGVRATPRGMLSALAATGRPNTNGDIEGCVNPAAVVIETPWTLPEVPPLVRNAAFAPETTSAKPLLLTDGEENSAALALENSTVEDLATVNAGGNANSRRVLEVTWISVSEASRLSELEP